jgi:plastocyanin
LDKRLLLTLLSLIIVTGLDHVGGGSEPPSPIGDVSIPVNADTRGPQGYRPDPAVVTLGATVTWTNHDTVWHTVTSDTEQLFGSEPIPAGGGFAHTFSTAGTFP